VGTPIRLRTTTNIANSMNAMLPAADMRPTRRSRLTATHTASGTNTNDASSFTNSASTKKQVYMRQRRSTAA
jgi:hypothetical protein